MLYLLPLVLSAVLASGFSNIPSEQLAAAQLSPETLAQIRTYQGPESRCWNDKRLYSIMKELQSKGLTEFLELICLDDRFPYGLVLGVAAQHLDTSLIEVCLAKAKRHGHAGLEKALLTSVSDLYFKDSLDAPTVITVAQVDAVAGFLEVLLKDDLDRNPHSFLKFELMVAKILSKVPSHRLLDVIISNQHMPVSKNRWIPNDDTRILPSDWYILIKESVKRSDLIAVIKILFFWSNFQQAYDLDYTAHPETHILSIVLDENPRLFTLMTLQPGLFRVFLKSEIRDDPSSARWLIEAPDSLNLILENDSITEEEKYSAYLQTFLESDFNSDIDFACFFVASSYNGISDEVVIARAVRSGDVAAIEILLGCSLIKVKHLGAIFTSGHFQSVYPAIDKKLGSTDFSQLTYSDSPAIFALVTLMSSGNIPVVAQASHVMQIAGEAGNMKTLERLDRLMREWRTILFST